MSKTRWILVAALTPLLVLALALAGCEMDSRTSNRNDGSSPQPTPAYAYSVSTLDYIEAPEFDTQSVLAAQSNAGIPPAPFSSRAGLQSGVTAIAGGQLVTEEPERALTYPKASPTDEMWIICQPETAAAPNKDDIPGSGALMTRLQGQTDPVPVPLEHTEVSGSIAGFVAGVNVKQQFHNPFNEKIEAVYVFPLPQNSAVNAFVMTIGDRHIRGIIRKRAEAEQLYKDARAQGYVASLLTQERPNIFTQRVANIEPGKRIDVDITYFNTLSYSDGWYEFVFPMVVGPRFNPPWQAANGEGIGHAVRGQPGSTGQQVEVQYLAPNERSGHDIALNLAIEAGVKIDKVESRSHRFELKKDGATRVHVRLADDDSIPNKDFVLRYRVAGSAVKPGLLVQPDADGSGGTFAMMLTPPADLSGLPQGPLELVFVLDCSGSMQGRPLEQAKAAIVQALGRLRPEDSFQIIRFSNDASSLGAAPLDASPENLKKGKRYLAGLSANGGTYMDRGIRAALEFPHDPERLRFVAFLTDGYIGNEAQILREIDQRLGDSRIFSFGVGSSPNRYLMESMAKVGRGAVAYVGLEHEAEPVMDLFLDRVERAALTDIDLDFAGVKVGEVYPPRIPDLFVGRPVVAIGRYEGSPSDHDWSKVRVRGRAGGADRNFAVGSPADIDAIGNDTLSVVWARMKIADIAGREALAPNDSERSELGGMVEQIALEHGLMSAYTAFVAVDSSRVTEGEHGTTIGVPVPVPEGVRYDTTVGAAGG
ncbi:MAG: VIT domain-containing protein [Phycisphaerales bacterium]